MVNWTGVGRRAVSAGTGSGGAPSGAGLGVVCGIAAVFAVPVLIGHAMSGGVVESAPPPAHDWSAVSQSDEPQPRDALADARALADREGAARADWAAQRVTLTAKPPKQPKQPQPKAQPKASKQQSSVAPKASKQQQPKAPKAQSAPKQAKQAQPSSTTAVTQKTTTSSVGVTSTSTTTKTTTKG